MPPVPHATLPLHQVPRIATRVLAGPHLGASDTSIWEQWIEPQGYIPLHYHDTEEVLVLLQGSVSLTLDNTTSEAAGPATIIIPAGQVHGLRTLGDSPVHLLAVFPTAHPTILAPDGSVRLLPWEDFGESDKPP